ncbi:hypothetical protein LCGC14_1073120 [marine sediment metagenome]|uniref:Uncharacterized protein n=1 Tax=marine sediment metagenome TaxID=412755 RepID=A0A0F9QNH9_9ZZZZ
MIKDTSDAIDEKINSIMARIKLSDVDLILATLSVVIYSTETNVDIIELFNLLDLDSFIKIISLFDGRTVQLPTKKQFRNSLLLSILYYYREIKKMEWEDIKKEFPFDISSISYGIQIKNLNSWVKDKMVQLLKKVDKDNINFFRGPKNEK